LWTLEVNDILKANDVGLQFLHKAYSTKKMKTGKFVLTPDDVLNMIEVASNQDIAGINCQVLAKKSDDVVLAYSLSKMTIIDEMEGFERYTQMQLVEFYEFIGRLSYLIFFDTPSLTS